MPIRGPRGSTPRVRARFFQQLADRGAVRRIRGALAAAADEPAWAVLSARRLDYQGQDAVLTAFTPINHLKPLEQRLELWAKVFEASSEGIVILDRHGRVLSANRAFCRATGFDPIELIDQELDFVSVVDVPVPQARECGTPPRRAAGGAAKWPCAGAMAAASRPG